VVLSTLAQKLDLAGRTWATESGEHLVDVIRNDYLSGQVLNRRTSRLINSIFARKLGGPRFEFGTNVEYGAMWEKGWTQSTTIFPKPGHKFLRWPVSKGFERVGGRRYSQTSYIFARKVVLPPQKPRKFLEPARDREIPWMQSLADKLYQGALNQHFTNRVIRIGK
jgi:hypothetical protein